MVISLRLWIEKIGDSQGKTLKDIIVTAQFAVDANVSDIDFYCLNTDIGPKLKIFGKHVKFLEIIKL